MTGVFTCDYGELTAEEIRKADVEGRHFGAAVRVSRIQEYLGWLLFLAPGPLSAYPPVAAIRGVDQRRTIYCPALGRLAYYGVDCV